jgi:hypothetical protein
MKIDFSPSAAAAWMQLSDLERIRVELALRRLQLSKPTDAPGVFQVKSYDLLITAEIGAADAPIVLREIRRIAAPGS